MKNKNPILYFGIISGLILGSWLIISFLFMKNTTEFNMEFGMKVGYTGMIISMSLIYFGLKKKQQNLNELGKSLTFGKAFTNALLMAVIASAFYGLAWTIYVMANPEVIDYIKIEFMKSAKTPEAVTKMTKELKFIEMIYKNPFLNFVFTSIVEPMPVGLFMSFVCSFLVVRKKKSQGN